MKFIVLALATLTAFVAATPVSTSVVPSVTPVPLPSPIPSPRVCDKRCAFEPPKNCGKPFVPFRTSKQCWACCSIVEPEMGIGPNEDGIYWRE
ncbi:hypothetical protein P154DRAFT_526637 [Amniculicola lignicola CBS 123094]|uniref:Uncharacterized protein n=1 Tax=Amniculicola lignicola CBS 123094 TaxID=1392246 RepID=A0A6A5W242_9PLEO|nr:hypothetical protein P154DRAFT_526637 [Amniculicola lignicola CBS 123094]